MKAKNNPDLPRPVQFLIIKHNLDRMNWTDWKIFTRLLKALDKLDKNHCKKSIFEL